MANRNGNRLVPRRGQMTDLVEEQHTAQAKLRAAVFNAVSESDITEVVKSIVEKAKGGDKIALRYLFDYVLGGRVTTAVQNNVYVDQHSEPPATAARPGSAEKIEVLRGRLANGRDLFSTLDNDG